MDPYDVIIVGGGAAGLMCAQVAGHRGRRVAVLESANRIGKKILMSGGGRCNFTNLHCSPENFVSSNPQFCISALSRYTQWDFIALVEQHGIAYHEKTDGQLFCDDSSKQILAMLETRCRQAGVHIQTHCTIESVSYREGFVVETADASYHAPSLVIASGGLSIPKMGATDFGFRLARQFGLDIRETRAGLVPFTLSGAMQAMAGRLAGVSTRVTLSTGFERVTDNMLFTHRGLSGPAALQISNYWQPGHPVVIDLLPDDNAEQWLSAAKAQQPKALLRSLLGVRLPRALVLELQQLWWPQAAERCLAELPETLLQHLARRLQGWAITPAGTEGYRSAEVTLGGIDTQALSSKTMACRDLPRLYCIGEVVDVTGQLGGFNFQWAWSSGHAAGQAV